MTESQTKNLLEMPYLERQLVIVQSDEVVDAARRTEENLRPQDGPADWKSIAARIGKVAIKYSKYGPVIAVATEAIHAWAKARESGLNILQISRAEAKSLRFPPGHPREQTLYVAHPALPSVY